MVAHVCNHCIYEVGAGESEVLGHPQLQNDFKLCLCYVRAHIGYFSVAVINYHDQRNLWKKEFIWAQSSREGEAVMLTKHGSKTQKWWLEQRATGPHLKL